MGASVSISNLGKSPFVFSTGDLARQANGSVCAAYGDTVVLATACMSKEPSPGKGYFPLVVDYQERTYAMGKIPGGFFKKEGRPKDDEILTARLIDRPLRPLFPKGLTNEVQVVAMVLSSDAKNDPDVLAINAASCALFISDIPFDNPVGAVRISKVEGKFLVNPTYTERENSAMDLIVVGTAEKVGMLEGTLDEIGEEEVLEAIRFARNPINELIDLQKKLRKETGREKREVPLSQIDENLLKQVKDKAGAKIAEAYEVSEKEEREKVYAEILASLNESLVTEGGDVTESDVKGAFFALEGEFVRRQILEEEKRPDGRKLEDIRPIECKVNALPRTHGSAIFTRGQTQSLAVITLGTSSDEQFIEALEGETTKNFMLHYSFPPFSVGEIKMLRGPSRREVGHGALAEKSLLPVIPSKEEFPYTIRIVSEILESNGSSSMASACAASLSLMDAGVPIKEPVAGIAIGLISDGKRYKILTDIAGAEDHYGDMDFKVAGTKKGITAIQLDTKIDGLTIGITEEALQRAKKARLAVLANMESALAAPRETLSEYAPKIKSFEIDPDKIGTVIGPGGKTIRRMSRENNVTIDIDDERSAVSVVAQTTEELDKAVKQIQNLIRDVEVGDIYEAKVEKIVSFGAFCELAPGKSGLVHISEIAEGFVKDASEFLKEGQIVKVKVIGIDPQGKIKVSIKQANS